VIPSAIVICWRMSDPWVPTSKVSRLIPATPYGVGAFLLAGSEVYQLARK
jgi:hypothetical protein